jgi:hypothetical protein
MKKIVVLSAAWIILSCNQAKTPEKNTPAESSPAETVPTPPSDSTVMKFSDEEMWLSNLLSDKKETREAAFKKYLAVRDTSDGAKSQIMTGYIKTYFSTYPKEFLIQYTAMSKREKQHALEDIAYEFYASGTNYKVDLDEYFSGITKSCTDCSAGLLNTLRDVKQRIYKDVSKMST